MGCDIHVYIEYKNRKIESDGHISKDFGTDGLSNQVIQLKNNLHATKDV